MTSTDYMLHRDNGRVAGMVASGSVRGEHSRDGVGFVERCEPLNVCEGVLIGAELRGELEDYTDLGRTKP
jgi:hypothetical protein